MKEWLKNAVFYEIYPQSFKDSNGDGIGDINGIIEKLDYIEDMGFTGIWLNPCFASPFYDAGYDVEDFYQVAPRYGTNNDLENLFIEAHKRGIKVLLDLVPGHTAVTSKWFKESMKDEENPYKNRYIWTNDMNINRPEIKNIKGYIAGFSERLGACAVNYFSTQPALNYGFAKVTEDWQFSVDSKEAKETRDELINVMRFWLKMGCDGFRVDMAAYLVKADDDDNSYTIKLWNDIFAIVNKEFPNAAFVSEWGMGKKAIPSGFDMDFMIGNCISFNNYLYRCETAYFTTNSNEDITKWLNVYMENYQKTKGKGLLCFISGNHDVARVGKYLDEQRMRLMFAFLLSMPGAPFVYYGDEIGMKYVEGLKSVEGSYQRTGSRTPMQWDNTKNAGFSTADEEKLYIPMDNSPNRPTVMEQQNDENSLLNEVKKLIKIRKENEPLQSEAQFIPMHITNEYPMVYLRKGAQKNILIAINPSNNAAQIDCDMTAKNVIYSYGKKTTLEDGKLTVEPLSAAYIEV